MLHLFAHPVAYCWEFCAKFEAGQTFSPVRTDSTLLANNKLGLSLIFRAAVANKDSPVTFLQNLIVSP